MIRFFTIFMRRLLGVINPQPRVGGLEVTGNLLEFAMVKGGKITTVSVRLPPGTVEGGKVKDANLLKSAALELHQKIAVGAKKVYAILNIPEQSVYTHVFVLPQTPAERLEEAVSLNLQVASPLEYSQVYSDWEKIGDRRANDDQTEILSAFAPRAVVDEFVAAFTAAYFVIVAVEASGLSFARLIRRSKIAQEAPSIVLARLTSDGLSFFIIRAGYLYFSHFVPWQGEQITVHLLEETISRETQRVVNFYRSHWPGTLGAVFYIAPTPTLGTVMEAILSKQGSFPVHSFGEVLGEVTGGSGADSRDPGGAVALSSAFRGEIPRFEDTMISLASSGTEEEFKRQEFLNFIRIWRTIILAILVFFLGVFVATDFFFVSLEDSIKAQQTSAGSVAETREFESIRNAQERTNQIIALVFKARGERATPLPFLRRLLDIGGTNHISFDRIWAQGDTVAISVNARASAEANIVSFKEMLAADSLFGTVDLPLSTISKSSDNVVSFTMTIRPSASVFTVAPAASAPAIASSTIPAENVPPIFIATSTLLRSTSTVSSPTKKNNR